MRRAGAVMSVKDTVLVTGGAGYIGSHMVLQLRDRGERVVVIDNLSTGFRQAVRDAPLVVGDVGDRGLLARVLAEHEVGTVMHFAAQHHRARIGPRPAQVLRQQHLPATRNLLASLPAARRAQLRVLLHRGRVRHSRRRAWRARTTPLAPINPYGTSKLMSEWMLRDLAARQRPALRRAALLQCRRIRSRSAASASPPRKATLLVKVACEASVGKRACVTSYGTDYDDADGTGVRDYIHVEDLARAHLCALDYLRDGRRFANPQLRLRPRLQRARGAAQRRTASAGRPLRVREEPRREGDPPALVAGRTGSARCSAGSPRLDDLDDDRAQLPALGGEAACGNPGRLREPGSPAGDRHRRAHRN